MSEIGPARARRFNQILSMRHRPWTFAEDHVLPGFFENSRYTRRRRGTEDEVVLPVLFITGAAQSGSELRPMPRPVQKRVREAFAAAGRHVFRGRRKGHDLVPFYVVRLFENFSPCQERRVCDGENGIRGSLINAVGESDWISYGGKRDRLAQQPFGKK